MANVALVKRIWKLDVNLTLVKGIGEPDVKFDVEVTQSHDPEETLPVRLQARVHGCRTADGETTLDLKHTNFWVHCNQ